VGHSERRRDQGETDELIGRKLIRCIEGGLRPILCVGEQLTERESGQAEATVRAQLQGALSVVLAAGAFPSQLVVAYEPVWAIGTGDVATPGQAQEAHAFLRGKAAALGSPELAAQLRILYGGSVKPGNAKELMGVANVDGALIGGASLKSDDFLAIYRAYEALTA
jgi:triosephosphate isomerase